MIQNGTYLNVIDNSGAKNVCCIKVSSGYRNRYATIGDVIVVSVKNLRTKRRATSKVKKGEVLADIEKVIIEKNAGSGVEHCRFDARH